MDSTRWTHPDTGDVYEIPDEDAPPLACTTFAYLLELEDLSTYSDAVVAWQRRGSFGPPPQLAHRIGDLQPYLVERAR